MSDKPIITDLFEGSSKEFDTRKVLNRAEKYSFDEGFMENLKEEGLTLEMIEAIPNKVPIFKYLTQITIHGVFPETQVERIHGYKNCIRNQNGTLGIKYNAIDVKKKKELNEKLKFILLHLNIPVPILEHTSNSLAFRLISTELEPIKEMYDRINTSLFYGRKYAYRSSHPFYGTFYNLVVELGVMKAEMTWPIITNWTGITEEKYNELKKIEDDKKAALKLEQEAEKERQTKLCNENYEASLTQLTNLPVWDGVISDNIILVSGRKNPTEPSFEFVRLLPVNFNKVQCVHQTHNELATGFETDPVPVITTRTKAALTEKLEKKKWFVWKQGEKPQEKQKPKPKMETKASQPMQTVNPDDLELIEYSQKAIALFGKTKIYAKQLGKEGLRGTFNNFLTHPITKKTTPGWIFPKTRTAEIEEALKMKLTPLNMAMSA